MILGFAVTAITVGKQLEPYTPERLLQISATLSLLVVVVTGLCLWGLEGRTHHLVAENASTSRSADTPQMEQAAQELHSTAGVKKQSFKEDQLVFGKSRWAIKPWNKVGLPANNVICCS